MRDVSPAKTPAGPLGLMRRGAFSDEMREQSTALVKQAIERFIEDQLAADIELGRLRSRVAGLHERPAAVDEEASAAIEALRAHQHARVKERIAEFRHSPIWPETMQLAIPAAGGLQVVAPPYDVAWSTGRAGANINGTMNVAAGGVSTDLSEYSAAAVGFFVTADVPVTSIVDVKPQAPFAYQWWNTLYSGNGSSSSLSSGGVGIMAYVANQASPYRVDRATVWLSSRADPHVTVWNPHVTYKSEVSTLGYPVIQWEDAYHEGQGLITPTVLLASRRDFSVTAWPGCTILVWIFCWTHDWIHTSGGLLTTAQSAINASVPFVVVDSRPAPIVK
ncbi:hypothetical protein GCM10010123_46590 [Pilimelia anulata]|uniref:Uncharacterized protein n=1 Tax=Pilimelia anulata TaxID=53371 RepID=A0A8J3BFI6_9ACTN|nr:hypothetical protein [Pilimelia anulata]GGK11324.1 hypothetical protein GCM10010123_46590 [Pilimelia anulata]